ncbi:hypothetical protein HM1_2690 [Heliomicrobium modesticaldum Ice1]|uniref:Uncharacterized protein n=1 Tax=Heliobacterium modesticaldum (strain ATCC 51547 / Ice1) TaxID=498761 RepID=B0TBU6_HELMI|nr:hypothetical protein HM1_2690 [Heliomicrobium modesticaldum Ice1]
MDMALDDPGDDHASLRIDDPVCEEGGLAIACRAGFTY